MKGVAAMNVVFERCCGLDIHKKLVVACVITPASDGSIRKEIRSFGAMTDELLALADWLNSKGVTHVAMESTGVYWQPVFNLLEGTFQLLLVNAQHIKAVPGRKSDVKDCEWIADLLRHGLLRTSFVPGLPQRELRELVRYRTSLVRERSAEVNRLQKTLEGANIKLASVATDVMGNSGRQMLEALVDGTANPETMAQMAKGRLRNKIPELERALAGRFGAHQRFMVAQQLAHIDFLEETLERLSQEIGDRLRPFEELLARLESIPGVGRRIAEILVAEIGTEVNQFPTAGHLASWAGMAPGSNESAGKRLSGATRKGNPWLSAALVEAANAAGHKKEGYLRAQLARLTARLGYKKAVVAVAHAILVIVYNVIKKGTAYQDLGSAYFDHRNAKVVESRLIRRLEGLGYIVTLQPTPQTPTGPEPGVAPAA